MSRWVTHAFLALLLAGLASVSPNAFASITATAVRSAGNPFFSMSTDPATGKFYSRNGYSGEPAITEYSNAAAFEAGVSSGAINLSPGSYFGTYFAANNGNLFARTNNNVGAHVGRWDATTGAQEASGSIPDMGGINAQHTFNWGGFSGVNWLQDSTGLYVFGKQETGDVWQLNRMDQNLNVVDTWTFAEDTLGFAFLINGHLFTGDSYDTLFVSNVLDLGTGLRTATSIDFTGAPLFGYWSNMFYDPVGDALYLHNAGENIYKVADAAEQFGVAASDAVPEPWSLLVWGGLAGVAVIVARRPGRRLANDRGR